MTSKDQDWNHLHQSTFIDFWLKWF